MDYALGEVENKSLLLLLKGILYEREDMDNDALLSYVQSQIESKNQEQKETAGKYIFNMFN